MSDGDKIAESLRERGSGTKSRLVSGDLALNCRIQYDNRPKFLRREIAEKPDVARAGEKMYYLSAGFLIFRQSSSSRD